MELQMLGLSEARAKLFDLADDPRPSLLLRHSKPRAVLVPYDKWVALNLEVEKLKDALAEQGGRTNSPTLKLPAPPIDLERNARRLSDVLDLAERLPYRPRRRLKYPAFPRRPA